MKIVSKVLPCLILVGMLTGCHTVSVKSQKVSQAPPIDGSLDGWSHKAAAVLGDSSVTLWSEHDNNYLYLAVRSRDPEYREDFRRAGITVWVDLNGGKSKDLEVLFPALTSVRFNRNQGGFWQSYTAEEKALVEEKLKKQEKGVLVIDHKGDKQQVFPAGTSGEFDAASDISKGVLVVELQIPLHYNDSTLHIDLPPGQKKIGVGIGMGYHRPGVASNSHYGRGESGYMGRQGSGGGGMRMGLSEWKEFWLEVNLENSK